MVNKNGRSKIRFYWCFGLFPETNFKVLKLVYALFTLFVKKVLMVNIKNLKHCKNLLKISNEIKQYVKNMIVKFD